jgi:threonine dehydrogenase-like Zn-dependent dehydrogenase
VKAVVFRGPGSLSVVERPEPQPGKGEIVVRPSHVALSSVDFHRPGQSGSGARCSPSAGQVIGSEFCGVVERVADDVDTVRLGDRVSIDPRHYCGECYQCRAGQFSTCERDQRLLGTAGLDGGLAERVAAPARSCYPVPDDVTDLQACLVPAVVRATHAVRSVTPGIADTVGIFGLDDIGLATLQWVRPITVGPVIAVDPIERRRQAARRLGADIVVDPGEDLQQVLSAAAPFGLDPIFLSINDLLPADRDLLARAFPVLRLKGAIVITHIVGNQAWEAMEAVPYLPLRKEASIHNVGGVAHEKPLAGGRERGDWVVTLQALRARRIDADALDVRVFPFSQMTNADDLNEVLQHVPRDFSKVVFSMGGEAA